MTIATPWLQHYPADVDWHLKLRAMPVFQMLDDTAATFPNHTAIDFLDATLTYGQLHQRVNTLAASLQQMGIHKGTVVALCLPNCPQFIIAHYAILKAGGIVVHISPLCAPPEVKLQLKDSGARIAVTANLNALYPKLAAFIGTTLDTIIVSDFSSALPPLKRVLFRLFKRKDITTIPHNPQHVWFETLTHGTLNPAPVHITPATDIAVIQYTGGTTGTPKGVLLTHANITSNAQQCSAWCGIDAPGTGRTMAVLPFFHVFAMTTCMHYGILRGSTIIMQPKFVLKDVLKGIHRKRPTIMPGVPTMFNALCNSALTSKYNLRSIKSCISGGAPLPLEVKQRFEAVTNCVLVEGYGLTEAAPVIAANPVRGINKAGSIGLPLPGTTVLIEDMEQPGTFLPPGDKHVGELCAIAPQVMLGYHGKPDDTASSLPTLPDGTRYLRTGDIAYLDEDGYIFIVDRKKDMILVGGFNVYPRHVEEALYEHPAVLEAAVIGKPDDYKGESVHAFVALKPGQTVSADAITQFLGERLGKYQLPKTITFRDALPKTMVGKIDKKALKAGS